MNFAFLSGRMSAVSSAARAACLLPLAGIALLAVLAGCSAKAPSGPPPTVRLALDGPPLAVVGEYAGMRLAGTLERKGMAGAGRMELQSAGPVGQSAASGQRTTAFTCTADLKDPPTEKARVRGVLACTGNRNFALSLRNLGPDQGVGIARESEQGDLLVLFYHVSAEEAERRFPEVKKDIQTARNMRGK